MDHNLPDERQSRQFPHQDAVAQRSRSALLFMLQEQYGNVLGKDYYIFISNEEENCVYKK